MRLSGGQPLCGVGQLRGRKPNAEPVEEEGADVGELGYPLIRSMTRLTVLCVVPVIDAAPRSGHGRLAQTR